MFDIFCKTLFENLCHLDRIKRIWSLTPMRAAKVQASLRIRAVSPEPPLLTHTSSESRGTFRQKARSLAPPNSWACAVKICHDGMLEDTNSLDGAHLKTEPRSLGYQVCSKVLLVVFLGNCMCIQWKVSNIVSRYMHFLDQLVHRPEIWPPGS